MGDSVIATMDTYDQQVYAIGKGPSTMTVTAPDTAVPLDTPLIIRGTVMDNSPGTQDDAMKLRFPKGVPVISDASMSDWMAYVYMQQPKPTNATGVPISLNVVDANGNYRTIGTTTSTVEGFYTYSWTPDIPGEYYVYASYGGSESYWPSTAVGSFVVDPAPEATAQPTTQPAGIADQYFVPAVAAIIVVIIIIGALMMLMIARKRP